MDIWSDEDLDRLEQRVDYALHTEDDGRTMIVAPQAIKDLIFAFRHLRAVNGTNGDGTDGDGPNGARAVPAGRAAAEARSISRSEGAGLPRA